MEREKDLMLLNLNRQMVDLKCAVNALSGICEGMVNGADDASVFLDGLEWTVDTVGNLTRKLDNTLSRFCQLPDAAPEAIRACRRGGGQ